MRFMDMILLQVWILKKQAAKLQEKRPNTKYDNGYKVGYDDALIEVLAYSKELGKQRNSIKEKKE